MPATRHATSIVFAASSGILLTLLTVTSVAEEWPSLPAQDATVQLPAQSWPLRPGPRDIRVLVHYPNTKLESVNADTGIMLTLHNWGGVDCVGTADPRALADRLNVVAICVNYLQSGKEESIHGPEPYDHGYYQALDALRALWWVYDGLKNTGRPFATGRLYATGGSGGGNVTLMANKLAPRTFACIIDMCGMKKLSDDIAFNLPGGVDLNARWKRDPNDRYHLSIDEQELRFVGNPDHLADMKQLGASSKIIVVHGVDDTTYPDALEMVHWMKMAKFDVEPIWVRPEMLDGKAFKSSGHSLGDRTEIVFKVAEKYLSTNGGNPRRHEGPTDFDIRDEVVYPTSNGAFVISFANGYPVGRFEPDNGPPSYSNHHDVRTFRAAAGQTALRNVGDKSVRRQFVMRTFSASNGHQPIRNESEWAIRRDHIVSHFETVSGQLPSPMLRVPLDVKTLSDEMVGDIRRVKVSYQSDPTDRVSAFILIPPKRVVATNVTTAPQRFAAVLCLQQTTDVGKDEPVGLRGDPELKYAMELAERGFVTITPDYPSFGEHAYDFAQSPFASGTIKAVWDNIRAIDLLESLEYVDARRIGCIGHSLGGHNGVFTALFDTRISALVSSCGFTSLAVDDVASWSGPRYMPRIASRFHNDATLVPFDFHELIASLAPRPVLVIATKRDDDFDVRGVESVVDSARSVYQLFDKSDNLAAIYPDAPHSFPKEARREAYEFLEKQLAR